MVPGDYRADYPDIKEYTSTELSALWNVDDPRSIPSLLPAFLRGYLENAYKKRPELFLKNEDELIALIPPRLKPKATDRRVRLSFWEEYNRVAALRDPSPNQNQAHINTENVIRGVCSRSWFTERFMQSPEKVAFMVCPPPSYLKALEEALVFGIDQVREILELPNYKTIRRGNKDVKVLDIPLLTVKTKITVALAQQARGSVIKHQVESKNMHLVSVLGHKQLPTMNAIHELAEEMTMEALDAKIHKLELLAKRQAKIAIAKDGEAVIEDPPTELEAEFEKLAVEDKPAVKPDDGE